MNKKEAHFQVKNKIHFTQMANSTVRDKNLTGLERAILMYILSHDLDKFKLTRSSIYGNFPDSKYSIKKSLVGLKNFGYLKIERLGFSNWRYVINDFGLQFSHNEREPDNVRPADNTEHRPYKNTNLKNNNKKVCEEKKEKCEEKQEKPTLQNEEPPIQPTEPQPQQSTATAHTQTPKPELPKPQPPEPGKPLNLPKLIKEVPTSILDLPDDDPELIALAEGFFGKHDPAMQAIEAESKVIEERYKAEIEKVKQEFRSQEILNMPKFTIESLLEASETFLGRVGIGFDNNPRRILNLIYRELPQDLVIKEDAKDVEILGDMIRRYMSSGKDERDSIAKKIYQAVECMLKIYVIKKYGDRFRETLYPQILNDNLVLYINCNPTFKYCLGGFSNDIDGVYSEVCRLVKKDASKMIAEIRLEQERQLRQLEANRKYELQQMFTIEQRQDFQSRTNDVLARSQGREVDETLAEPIRANLTEEESARLLYLIGLGEAATMDDRIEAKKLILKSKN